MKKFFLTLCLAAAAISPAAAQLQKYADQIRENPDRAASNYHYYEFVESDMTPAPKGFRPFYISHYSRHGSRYHTSDRFFRRCMPELALCDSLGLLSETGEALYADALAVYAEHEGMYGMLTTRGGQEQEAIGTRLYERFPEVFSAKDGRTKVRNASTTVQRSMISMMYFNTALAERAPKLDFSYVTGEKYYDYLCTLIEGYVPGDKFDNAVEDSMKVYVNPDVMFERIFREPEQAKKVIKNPHRFIRGIFMVAAISPNTDVHPDMMKYFPFEEQLGHWIMRNDYFYAGYANSAEMAELVAEIACPIIDDIIARADEALENGSDIVADFRFGHDTGLLPLVATLGIKGMDKEYSAYEAHEHWNSSFMIPMASNLQMVFYRNKAGEILVKLLYNEQETSIPALQAYSGPYYSWPVLRRYLMDIAG